MGLIVTRGPYDRSSLPLTEYHRPNYTAAAAPGAVWPGTPSAGTSGSRARTPDGSYAPGLQPGASLNGHVSAHLVSLPSGSAYFSSTASGIELHDVASRAAFCGWFVVDPLPDVYTNNFGYISRDEHQNFVLRYIKAGFGGETQNVLVLSVLGDTNFAVARKVITIDSGHVPHVVTFRITGGGRCQLGINEVPGASGDAADQAFIDPFAVSAIGGGTSSKLSIGYFGGVGQTGDLWEYALADTELDDFQFRNVIRGLRADYAQDFLP